MKENIKIAGSIVLKSIAKWALVLFLGCAITLFTFLIAFLWNIDLLFVENQTFLSYFKNLFHESSPGFVLIVGAPIFVIVYIVMAKKVSIQNAIHLLFLSKAGDYVMSKVIGTVEKIVRKKESSSKMMDKTILKLRVLQELKDDPKTSQLQRSIIRYGFRKVDLEDVNFQDENLDLVSVLSTKFNDFFAEMVKPSLLWFWLLLLVQFILMIACFF